MQAATAMLALGLWRAICVRLNCESRTSSLAPPKMRLRPASATPKSLLFVTDRLKWKRFDKGLNFRRRLDAQTYGGDDRRTDSGADAADRKTWASDRYHFGQG